MSDIYREASKFETKKRRMQKARDEAVRRAESRLVVQLDAAYNALPEQVRIIVDAANERAAAE